MFRFSSNQPFSLTFCSDEVFEYGGLFTLPLFPLSGVDCTLCAEQVFEYGRVFTLPVFILSGVDSNQLIWFRKKLLLLKSSSSTHCSFAIIVVAIGYMTS